MQLSFLFGLLRNSVSDQFCVEALTPFPRRLGLRVRIGVATGEIQEGRHILNSAVMSRAKRGQLLNHEDKPLSTLHRCPSSLLITLPCTFQLLT